MFFFSGFVVGFVMILANMCFFAALVVFYVTGSKFTKFKADLKQKIEADFKEGESKLSSIGK